MDFSKHTKFPYKIDCREYNRLRSTCINVCPGCNSASVNIPNKNLMKYVVIYDISVIRRVINIAVHNNNCSESIAYLISLDCR